MPENKPKNYDLLKFPIATLSIIAALFIAKWWLGLDFTMIQEIGTGGIKFRESQVEAITNLENRINELSARLSAFESGTGRQFEQKNIITNETAQTSDATARLFKTKLEGDETIIKGREGFIWIGNYNAASQKWDQPKLLQIDNTQPIATPPDLISPGSKYRLANNMALRQGLPKNDEEYFRGQPGIGSVPRGTLVEILEKPVGIDREFAVQIWVKIMVAE